MARITSKDFKGVTKEASVFSDKPIVKMKESGIFKKHSHKHSHKK